MRKFTLLLIGIVSVAYELPAQDSSAAWRWVREAPRRAELLAGCYRLRAAIIDSVHVPARFRLSSSKVRALGYHRVAHFWTDVPRSGGETRPIWTPRTDDSLEIELRPRSTGGPFTRYVILAAVRDDSIVGEYQEREWTRDTTTILGARITG